MKTKVLENLKNVYTNEELDNLLEDECIYWNDDVEIVQSFVLKSIRQFSEENGAEQPLLPMFRDDEDKQYSLKLLHDTILNEKKYRTLIEKHTEKWDFDRIAFMDMVIMQVALVRDLHLRVNPHERLSERVHRDCQRV